jgi:hypothetical protein
MKEAQIFENWANQIMEGTWALPDTPEAQAKLDELMSRELIVGPDATNAKEQLYDVIGDDVLFDILSDLADQDPRANCWDDTDVQARLQELGIQMNTTPDAEQQQPVAPAAGQQAPGTAPEQAVAEDQLDELSPATLSSYGRKAAGQAGWAHGVASALKGPEGDPYAKLQQKRAAGVKQAVGKGANVNMGNVEPYDWAKQGGYGDATNPAIRKRGMAENAELNTMLKYAGVPVQESRIHENSEYTYEKVAKILARENPGLATDRHSDEFYSAVYHELIAIGMTPKAARNLISYDEDFMSDVASAYDHYQSNPGLDESNSGMIMPEADPMATVEAMPDLSAPVLEGSCNSTMEGEYCPEHGLAECGMYEMGTVAGSVAPVIGEAPQDPINYNGAITGSYYESKDGDALLARIKSLALLK